MVHDVYFGTHLRPHAWAACVPTATAACCSVGGHAQVRRIVGERMIVGVSANTITEARQAAADGADYVGVGAVFATTTKAESKAIGLEGLREVTEASPVPVVAIGGVNSSNVASVMGCGCAGVAVVSCVFDQEDIIGAVHSLRRHMGLKIPKKAPLARSHG